jgi:c-di-GMP-related signal transduction protein
LIRLLAVEHTKCKEIQLTCKKFGIRTIASHINSDISFKEAKKLDFDYYQGFFLGKPSLEFN